MLNSSALVSVMKVVVMMLMCVGTGVEAAPTDRGFAKPLPSLTHASAVPEKTNPSQFLKHWLLSTKAAGVDGTTRTDKTTTRTITAGVREGRVRSSSETAGPDKRGQMLKMISAMDELHRAFNSTRRITIMPRANGKHSGRKNRVHPAAEGGVKPTTVAPSAVSSTASRASADVLVPSLTGRNVKKSLPTQTKKTNKRVCFWKYCSQN
ncbi:hypothetical protein CesoFtcFv8_027642 [Champsocephalus esox]|uniref:Urotensin II-related peptide n=2 Tax=Champsocephalus TaxID=52236 RepID=A0AAN8GUK6_CHAGU|nr:hypothetical protein CesoFtcFv8_027642 [Champsocephalus esox]KAK5891353.1 hypothetical protein CgunFtcFv8_018616 [Champsocephalus gunnari]